MKKIFVKMKYAAGVVLVISIMVSCEKGSLTDLNIDPNEITFAIPEYSFTAACLNSNPGQQFRSLGQGLQYFASYKEVPATGDKFYNFSGTGGSFGIYTGQWNRLLQLSGRIPGDENVNRRAACEILRILAFHQETDQIGDMPYSEAMKGADLREPVYDTQESIYKTMLAELETAINSMNASKLNVFGNADIFYKGDVAKWKKLGYSLMLRLGMRMSEVEPATAKTWVEKAVAGGPMTDFADIAYLQFKDVVDMYNPRVNGMITGDYAAPGGDNVEGGKWAARFINHLKRTQDPRLPILSVVWQKSGSVYVANKDTSIQKGMVNGALNTKPTDFETYSEPSLLYLHRGSPIIVMSPAESYLLIAEAAVRGWNVGTTAEEAYNKGVRAAMNQWALWPSVEPHSGVITTEQVDAYLNYNPFLSSGTYEQKLEQIATQFWVSLLGDDHEVWSNWRRIKYPVFNYKNWRDDDGTLIFYPGNVTAGRMWRRFSIPNGERNVNKVNYFDAIAKQGFTEDQLDLLQGRMWWDVGPGLGQLE